LGEFGGLEKPVGQFRPNVQYIAIKMIFKSVLKIDNSVPLELMGA
jgi:hypothetical protein